MSPRFVVPLPLLAVLLLAPAASGDVGRTPETCPDAFSCGALSARLGGRESDYAGSFKAGKRACALDPMFCEAYAQLFVSIAPRNGGDAARGIKMLDALCKKGDTNACSTLARDYSRPPRGSGLAPDLAKAEKMYDADCNKGDSLACSAQGDILLKTDPSRALEKFDKGCNGTDTYALGVCGTIADKLSKGELGGKPDRKAALGYLRRSCPGGYRCDLGVRLALEENDVASAKTFGRKGCEDRYCEVMAPLEKRDPAWAKQQYTELCAKKNVSACRALQRLP